ncbi:MAG: transglutaminase-like cysteine peptidase [Rhodospirillales bacterium]|nr:transglutaminase-like cysteine peptidase [Rhodospirillales bacterium]
MPDLFPGFAVARVDARLPLPQWEEIISALRRDSARVEACRADPGCSDRPARRVAGLVERLASSDRSHQIAAVNEAVNAVPYESDAQKFGTQDRWQSPLDFFDGSGDCEDFAIAKYFMLRQLGVSDDDLRIVIYFEPRNQAMHAILASTADGRMAILDNRSARITSVADYPAAAPKYAVNVGKRWVFVRLDERLAGREKEVVEMPMPAEATPGR